MFLTVFFVTRGIAQPTDQILSLLLNFAQVEDRKN